MSPCVAHLKFDFTLKSNRRHGFDGAGASASTAAACVAASLGGSVAAAAVAVGAGSALGFLGGRARCLPRLQPGMAKNSSKSKAPRSQQGQTLRRS